MRHQLSACAVGPDADGGVHALHHAGELDQVARVVRRGRAAVVVRQVALVTDLPVLDVVASRDICVSDPLAGRLEQLRAGRRNAPGLRGFVHRVVAHDDGRYAPDVPTDLHELVEIERRRSERVAVRLDEIAVVRGPFLVGGIFTRGPSRERRDRARIRRNGPQIAVRFLAPGIAQVLDAGHAQRLRQTLQCARTVCVIIQQEIHVDADGLSLHVRHHRGRVHRHHILRGGRCAHAQAEHERDDDGWAVLHGAPGCNRAVTPRGWALTAGAQLLRCFSSG